MTTKEAEMIIGNCIDYYMQIIDHELKIKEKEKINEAWEVIEKKLDE